MVLPLVAAPAAGVNNLNKSKMAMTPMTFFIRQNLVQLNVPVIWIVKATVPAWTGLGDTSLKGKPQAQSHPIPVKASERKVRILEQELVG